jgi:trimeric autotransporter adhesin
VTNQLISTVTGSSDGDLVGLDGVTEVGTSDFAILSTSWHDGSEAIGAVTLVDGTTGLNGQVTASNSLVGNHAGDLANGGITKLVDGNFVVASPSWDNEGVVDAGAVTFADSVTGRAGEKIEAANSVVGTAVDDNVGSGGVTPLTDDKFAVSSPNWDGADADVGAVSWVNGALVGAASVSTDNSLVGTTASDRVGSGGVTALTNGNYVVSSPDWDSTTAIDVGAVTWADGEEATAAAISSVNSIIGTTVADNVGSGGVTALTNDRYVVSSPFWDDGAIADVGAVTLADGNTTTAGTVTGSNSLVGNIVLDNVGIGGVTALTNGDYVVSSPFFTTAATFEAGAATWVDGALGAVGPLDEASSLVGATDFDHVGGGGVTALTNGNYVVSSPFWDSPTAADVGAVTWAVGNSATPDTVTAANSLVGTTAEDPGGLRTADNVGSGGVTALTDGNYVVSSPQWNGVQDAVGAVTWANGTTVTHVAVSAVNSLVGTRFEDHVGSAGVKALSNGALGRSVVVSDLWDNGAAETAADAGAATFGPAGGIVGSITSLNSAIGNPGAGLGDVRSASDRVTTDNTIVVATAQNRVLLLRLDDLLPPVLGAIPTDINTTATSGTASRLVTFATPSATDNRGVPSVVCAPASGSLFPIGVTTVTCTATDGAGLTDSGTFTITVNDVDPPVLGDHDDVSVTVSPGLTSRPVTFALPTATDNDHVQSVVCDRASGSVFPLGTTTVTCTATDDSGLTDTDSFTVTVTTASEPPPTPVPGPGPGPGSTPDYIALSGARLADTRTAQPTVDALFAGQGIRNAGSTYELTVTDRGGVSADASAVALNVTAVESTGDGYVTVFPCGSDQPTASNLNFETGAVVPNAVIAKVGVAGKVCLFVSAATHLVVDVDGYFPPSTHLHALNPARVLDTRLGPTTFDGQQQGVGVLGAGSTTAVQITGRASVPSDATAVVLNVTVTNPQAPGFATVFPCGAPTPNASTINYDVGSTVANMTVSKIGVGGTVCIYTSQESDLVVDVAGYFPLGSSYSALVPARLMDTRSSGPTIDGQFADVGARKAGEVTDLKAVNRGGVPESAGTVVLNITVTEPAAAGFITVYPCGVDTPLASHLNFEAGATVANAVVVKVGADGKVCLFSSKSTELIVDVTGFFPS